MDEQIGQTMEHIVRVQLAVDDDGPTLMETLMLIKNNQVGIYIPQEISIEIGLPPKI